MRASLKDGCAGRWGPEDDRKHEVQRFLLSFFMV